MSLIVILDKEAFERILDSKLATLSQQIDNQTRLIKRVLEKESDIMADLTNITAQVQATQDAEQSAITLLNHLSDLLHQSATDPAAIQALADQLQTNATALAAAVVANTPTAPATP